MTTFPTAFIAAARAELGVHELQPNSGPKIDAWLHAAGVASPNPWCAAFVYAMARKAGWKSKIDHPASCDGWIAWAIKNKRLIDRPSLGDLVVYNWDGGHQDHIGIVESIRPMSGNRFVISAIEGNTQGTNGALADGVYHRVRTIDAHSVKFIRLYAVAK